MGEAGLFRRAAGRDEARELFRRNVTAVELEPFSYCNRRCSYCPNAFIDRISDNKFVDDAVFHRTISDLAEIDYQHEVILSGYNEPLADKKILSYISAARQSLPAARLTVFTNGDYLNKDYVAELVEAGLSAMMISIHLGNTAKYDDIKILERINEMSVRIGIAAKFQHFCPQLSVLADYPHRKLEIRIFEQNYDALGGDRGGLLKHIPTGDPRTSPCSRPFNVVAIAYNGFVMPCCQLRSDAEEHKKYRVGHVMDFPSIFEAYASSSLVDWRRGLFTFGEKASPCDTCNQACIPDDAGERERREKLATEWGLAEPERVLEEA